MIEHDYAALFYHQVHQREAIILERTDMHSQNGTVAAALVDVVCSAVIRIDSAEYFCYVPLIYLLLVVYVSSVIWDYIPISH